MAGDIVKEFDGYDRILQEIEVCRKYGINYTADRDGAEKYIHRLHPPGMRVRVTDIVQESPSTKTLRLVSTDRTLPPFQAGQYIALTVEVDHLRTSRPYSISSPPNQVGHYDVTVKRVEGGLVSNHLLDRVKRGDVLESSGPAGNFYHNPLFHDPRMVFLAGGSGITPFMSMVREVLQCGLDRTVYLFYGSKDLHDIPFHGELSGFSGRFEHIHYIPVIEHPPEGYEGHCGVITAELIRRIIGDPEDHTFYLCGPKAMYDFCIPELEKMGVSRRKIRKEIYGPPMNMCEAPGWPPEVKADDLFTVVVNGVQRLRARAGESLLASLEKGGILIPSLCRCGECSKCRLKILSGRVFQPPGVLLRRSDRQFGYVHSCVSYPLGDLEVLI